MGRHSRGAVAVLAAAACLPGLATAQEGERRTVRAGPRYEAGWLKRTLLGSGYRHLWTTPLEVEVLDLARFAGGLEPLEPGGGNQTRTLHMRGADGRRYLFRSVDKFVERALPEDLQRTPIQSLFQDHISAFHPSGALAVPPLLDAAGVLHASPRLVIMPDDPRLGEYRAEFAGMLGQIEERPNEGEDGAPGFAGSTRVVGTDRLFERIEEDPHQVVVAEEYLAARLIDFLIGDTDRGSDQWRWAGEERKGEGLRFRPVPRDRDFAFLRSDGLLSPVARLAFPKVVKYGRSYPPVGALMFSSIHRDRPLLAGLSRRQWDSVVVALQASLDDDVLARAIAGLPHEHQRLEGGRMVDALAARRDGLPDVADRFYDRLSTEVDVGGTLEDDLGTVTVNEDGSVGVRMDALDGGSNPRPRFHRRFLPSETREVRLYLLEGADRVVIRGSGSSPITVRVIGGEGADTFLDSTAVGAVEIRFYDVDGATALRRDRAAPVDRRPFVPPEGEEGWVQRVVEREMFRDWGRSRSLRPAVDYGEGAGVIVGARLQRTRYGFRRAPHARSLWVEGRYALGSRGFGVEAGARRTWENSPVGASLVIAAEQFDAIRFYGFGNRTPVPTDGHGSALVMQDRAMATAGLSVQAGHTTRLGLGVRGRYIDPRPASGSPLEVADPFGAGAYGTVGAWVEAGFENARGGAFARRGVEVDARVSGDPGAWDAPAGSGAAEAEARVYLGLAGPGPTLALRAGGRRAWGSFPVQDAAFIGGKATLRGYRYQRFAGDGSVHASAELRAPLTRALLLVRGDLGVFGFADAGRVFVDGASPGGWHAGYGAGLAFTTLGLTGSGSWARGEEDRFYLDLGMSF